MAVSAAQVSGNGTITTENLNRELQYNFNNEKTAIENSDFYIYNAVKTYRIYKNGTIEDGNTLPTGYKQIEYIESTGSQFIDTNLKLPFSINILAKLTTTNEMEALLGCQNGKSPYNGTFIRTGAWGNFNFLENRIIQSYSFDNNIHRYIVHFYKDNASVIIDDIPYGNITTENQYLQYTVGT